MARPPRSSSQSHARRRWASKPPSPLQASTAWGVAHPGIEGSTDAGSEPSLLWMAVSHNAASRPAERSSAGDEMASEATMPSIASAVGSTPGLPLSR